MDESESVGSVVAHWWDARLIANGTRESAHAALEVRGLHTDGRSRGIQAHFRCEYSIVAEAPNHCSLAYYNAVVEEALILHTLPFAGPLSKVRWPLALW